MKKQRFTEEQIISVLKEQEVGAKVADLCRKHGISDATFYNWKAKYGGMEISEAKRLRGLEEENAKLKKSRRWKPGRQLRQNESSIWIRVFLLA
ncbi:transposase, partial [Brucella tritici]|uniref:transposase n=1 Tax=Brucella tritici TaxID=94626 RepID=UPI001F417C05